MSDSVGRSTRDDKAMIGLHPKGLPQSTKMSFSQHWQLDPDIDFLNHGSFGAAPTVVLEAQRALVDQLERDPIRFLAPERELLPKLDHVREVVAQLINAPANSVGFVRNATDGVNAVVRSMRLRGGDEIVITNHGYNACNNAVRFVTDQFNAVTRTAKVPFPVKSKDEVLQSVEKVFNERTRLLVIDHVTSSTGLVFPIEKLLAKASSHGIRVLIDGAHAPGMIPVDLGKLQPDYYTANHHKWLCGPKASGFLYVDPRWHHEVRPTVISHGANCHTEGRTRFLDEFDWIGTYDPTPILALPVAIEFLNSLYPGGLSELMQSNHDRALVAQGILANALQIDSPAPASMIGSLVSVPLRSRYGATRTDMTSLQRHFYDEHRIEVPIFPGPETESWLLRISMQAYNSLGQIDRLAKLLSETV